MRFFCQPYDADDDPTTFVWAGGATVNVYADASDAENRRHTIGTFTMAEPTMVCFMEAMKDRAEQGVRYD